MSDSKERITRLEQEIRADWPLVERDLPLTHQVGPADLIQLR